MWCMWSSHKPRSCLAFGKSCNYCGRSNHYAKCFKVASKMNVHTVDKNDEVMVDVVQAGAAEREELIMPIMVNKTTIPLKLDFGAM